jgi:creatinine amidohydrolase
VPDRSGRPRLTGKRLRTFFGDGNYGGHYQRSDEKMSAIWQIAVEETREMIEEGWDI